MKLTKLEQQSVQRALFFFASGSAVSSSDAPWHDYFGPGTPKTAKVTRYFNKYIPSSLNLSVGSMGGHGAFAQCSY